MPKLLSNEAVAACRRDGFYSPIRVLSAEEARSPGFVSWHQDSTYWGLEPDDVVTAWVAFTEVTPENGYMQVIPGSHKIDQLPHVDTFHKDNFLSRGQENEAALAAHADAIGRQVKALYQGTEKTAFRA